MPTSGNSSRSPRITVFTSPSCPWCTIAKHYIAHKGLQFREVNVVANPKGRLEMVRMTGQSGVPVIRIGEHAMVGWDEREFEKLLSGKFKQR